MTTTSRFRHSRTALAHSVSHAAWRGSFAMRPADAIFTPALKVGIAATLVLLSFGLAGQAQLAGIASLGALTSAFGRYQPYRRLSPMLAIVAGTMLAAILIGGLLGAAGIPMIVQIAVLSGIAALAAHLFSAFGITGPGAVILVFAAAAGSGYAQTFDAIPRALSLGFWPSVALVVVFQVLAELLVLKNYTLTTIAVTPMALIMTGLGSQLGPEAAFSRVADTLVGVVIGVLVAAASISLADRHHLQDSQ